MNELEKLQEESAFQARAIEQLNEALANQQQQINHLQEEVRVLTQLLRQWRAESRHNGGAEDIEHEIPPHY